MLRTLFVLALVSAGIKYSFQGGFYILLFYLWNAYFRPEQWAWSSIIYELRLSLTIGIALIVVSIFSSERLKLTAGPMLLFAFLAHTLFSTFFSPVASTLWPFWIEYAKVLLISYLIVRYVNTEDRLRLTLIVLALSLGFEGARQGWAQLVINPGGRNMNSWPMLGDNNGVAIGMLMLFPLLVALAQTTRDQSRYFGWFLSVGVLYRAISTYSRGGFLAASALAMHYALRARRRVAAVLGVVVLSIGVSFVMPDEYWDRISTVSNAAETTEANRIGFWMIGLDMANDYPFTGVGIDAYRRMYDRYDPTFGLHGRNRDIHSSWFGILSELGYPGLLLFVGLLGRTFYTARRVRRLARNRPDLAHLAIYATVFEAQVLVFAIGGTFITLQYKEFIWHVLALAMATDQIAVERASRVPVPDAPSSPAAPPAPEQSFVNPAVIERLKRQRQAGAAAPATARMQALDPRR